MKRVIPPPPPRASVPLIPGVTFAPPVEPAAPPAHGARRLRLLLEEFIRRDMEALRCYVPFGNALKFHQSQAKTRLLLGSNRSGKTNAFQADVAMVVTGTHPWRPKSPKENGRAYLVGWDQEFIGKVLAPKLLLPGALRLIRDEHTRRWRPVVPDQPYDAAHSEKWKDAPPLLPERWIKRVNWESKKDFVPRDIDIINGWKVSYYSSKGEPQRGNEINYAGISEELENKTWPRELQRGLVKRAGGLVYEATPQSSSAWLYNAFQESVAPDADKRLIEAFFLHVKDNKYLSEQERADFYAQLQTDEERRVCWDGEFLLGGAVVYKTYSRDRHVIPSCEPPKNWSRWMVVDPGVTTCAVTFWAIPNPKDDQGDLTKNWYEKHLFDELYLKGCSAEVFASAVAKKMGPYADGGFEGFVIDGRMGRQSQVGAGTTVEFEYAEALRRHGVSSRQTGHGFVRGSDDIKAREECLRRWMGSVSPDAPTPILRIHDRCASTIWEFPQQFYKQDSTGLVLNDQRIDRNNHAVTTCEYFAELDPRWVAPQRAKPKDDPVMKAFKRKQRLRRKQEGGGVSVGPPARTT